MASQISAIDKQSVHKICSGQVVLDLATAIKELVENSIDAGALSVGKTPRHDPYFFLFSKKKVPFVDVNFKENGLRGIEVIDDGSGIDPSNYESLGKKNYNETD